MTKPESLVVSKDLARQLKSAGWTKECFFYWCIGGENGVVVVRHGWGFPLMDAPTVGELLTELPLCIKRPDLEITRWPDLKFSISYSNDELETEVEFVEKLPQDALARLWLWCKERDLV